MKFKNSVIIFLILFLPIQLYGLTLEEERKYGQEIYLEIANSATINNDPYISIYLRNIKDNLENAANLPFPIVLTVIESTAADAFTTPGGYVYLTTGLIGMCDKEEEVAGVLAHEFAHNAKRHIAKRLEKEKYINIGMLATLIAGILIPDPKAKEVALVTGSASAMALSLKYSREDEDEADKVGASIADKAGYSGLGTADFLRKLRSAGGDKILPQYLLTHPYHEERILKIERAWAGSKSRIDGAFFPYLLVRVKVLHGHLTEEVRDTWVNKYTKNVNDPLTAYGISLMYSLTSNTNDSVRIAKSINSPYRSLLLGEIMVNSHQFGDAIGILRDEASPISRFFLAKAYEGNGDIGTSLSVLNELLQYGKTCPEIYYRYGMLIGRSGNQAKGYEYLGRYYLETGKQHLARSNLEKAITKYGINSQEAKNILKLLDTLKK
ncbi:MAG: M48 family metalloprotease [Proteobacteria bacterium]|nr:M48 family metalloprotease [Pseudomonadota bacterium]